MTKKIKNKRKTEEEIIDEIWYGPQNEYFNSCVDKIYRFLHDYGYYWGDKSVSPSRSEIEDTIRLLLSDAKKYYCCGTGRIQVDYVKEDNYFQISINL